MGKMKPGSGPSEVVLVPQESIYGLIYIIRGMKVMLDRDLAALYGVPTKALNQAVKRNSERFPGDFMFQMNQAEFKNWRSQFVTSNSDKKNWRSQFVMSNSDRMGLRRPPFAFTEHGVLMLSSVLNSPRAIQVNIQIMRTFVKLRDMLRTDDELRRKIETLERKFDRQNEENAEKFTVVFNTIEKLLGPPPEQPRKRIGF